MIFADTNLISESIRPKPDPKVAAWLREHDFELALPAIVLAEIKFGIERIRPDERAKSLDGFFRETRRHFARRIYAFDETSAAITVTVGPRTEAARILEPVTPLLPGSPRVLFVENEEYFDRPGLYGDALGDYPDNAQRYALRCGHGFFRYRPERQSHG